jgi:hypothetical protein
VLVAVGLTVVTAVVATLLVYRLSGSAGDHNAGSTGGSTTAGSTTAGSTSQPTVDGTSRPPSTLATSSPAATGAPLAPGTRNEIGFSWVPPDGWTRSAKTPSKVHYTSPDGTEEVAGSYTLAAGDLFAQWQGFERDSRDVTGYQKIQLKRTTFKGRDAVIWEYRFTDQGVRWESRQTGFDANGKSYQLNIWYHADVRTAALSTYAELEDSFTPL